MIEPITTSGPLKVLRYEHYCLCVIYRGSSNICIQQRIYIAAVKIQCLFRRVFAVSFADELRRIQIHINKMKLQVKQTECAIVIQKVARATTRLNGKKIAAQRVVMKEKLEFEKVRVQKREVTRCTSH